MEAQSKSSSFGRAWETSKDSMGLQLVLVQPIPQKLPVSLSASLSQIMPVFTELYTHMSPELALRDTTPFCAETDCQGSLLIPEVNSLRALKINLGRLFPVEPLFGE